MGGNKSEVLVGRLGGAFGIKGWLKVSSFTSPLDNIFAYTPWRLRGKHATLEVQPLEGRLHGKGAIVRFAGIDDRDRAEELKGMDIVVGRELLPEPEPGHYYWADLEGLRVERLDGTVLGHVTRMMEAGAADVMVVTGETRQLIPFVMGEVVAQVDLEAGCIRVDWDEFEQD